MDTRGMTENLIQWILSIDVVYALGWVKGLSPLDLLTNKWLLGIITAVGILLILLKAFRTLSLITGVLLLWSAKVYLMPGSGMEISLVKLVSFAIINLFVGVLWIYMFFIKGD